MGGPGAEEGDVGDRGPSHLALQRAGSFQGGLGGCLGARGLNSEAVGWFAIGRPQVLCVGVGARAQMAASWPGPPCWEEGQGETPHGSPKEASMHPKNMPAERARSSKNNDMKPAPSHPLFWSLNSAPAQTLATLGSRERVGGRALNGV